MQIANQVTKQPVEDVKHTTEAQQLDSVETIAEISTPQEQLMGELEAAKASETQTFQPTSTQDDTTTTPQQAQAQPANIVDNTNEITTLHTIAAANIQKLTTIADQDEAEFISGVEHVHGHK